MSKKYEKNPAFNAWVFADSVYEGRRYKDGSPQVIVPPDEWYSSAYNWLFANQRVVWRAISKAKKLRGKSAIYASYERIQLCEKLTASGQTFAIWGAPHDTLWFLIFAVGDLEIYRGVIEKEWEVARNGGSNISLLLNSWRNAWEHFIEYEGAELTALKATPRLEVS